ncbi:DUF3995 domain-containing protein [Bailinhaonella thermotolerans]|uniref:DUF3995 domain-containing protein n=1 Tax=Bailinhaonella thermotolerans TaxID=1070861 RepID=A0A3A4AED2_9ACTN|nr:DUF3995 domain-containing protein [Bailinhaonella thermotolerans]RJL25117.1 DUF3995 domain-containing protein [Bailinhaonella thermotolerans]
MNEATDTSAGRTRRWPGYGAAAWGFLFAAPSVYWALGGTSGITSTISPALVDLAERRVPWFVATLWVTAALKVAGGLLGLALLRRWGRLASLLLELASWGAAVLLAWHGLQFIGQGALIAAGVSEVPPEIDSVVRWYTFLWGPWFILGGVLLALAARAHRPLLPDPRAARHAALLGALGAAVVSASMLVLGIG